MNSLRRSLKFLLLFLTLNLFAQTKKDVVLVDVKASITKYMSRYMKNYNNYKSINWGNLEIKRTSYEDLPEGSLLIKKSQHEITLSKPYFYRCLIIQKNKEDFFHDLDYRKQMDSVELHMKRATYWEQKYNSINKHYTHNIKSYFIIHRFRGKNLLRPNQTNSILFVLDKHFKVIGLQDSTDFKNGTLSKQF
ncbi:MAG: hypothetical protein JWR05_3039 [Mucilaginibacter sp.]|nr:hypothetical protein [Mucilaginibacter sp.]